MYRARRLEDVVIFVESIGEPVLLFGESDGGALALGVAAATASDAPGPTDPSRLTSISVPTLLIFGTHTELRD